MTRHADPTDPAGTARLHSELTGADQRWTALCIAAWPAGPQAVAELLADDSPYLQALRGYDGLWVSGWTGGDVLDEEPADADTPPLAAARAAAAVAAALAYPPAAAELPERAGSRWLRLRVLPDPHAPAPLPVRLVDRSTAPLRSVLDRLGDHGRTAAEGYAALVAMHLAGAMPATHRRIGLPVLFDRGSAGATARLELRLLTDGPPGLYPDPARMAFLATDEAFQTSLARAWQGSRPAAAGRCVLWSVVDDSDGPCNDVVHDSLGAAFGVGLDELAYQASRFGTIRLRRLDRACAVTGALDAEGRIGPVGGWVNKLAAAAGTPWRIVAPERSRPDVAPLAERHGLRVDFAGTLADAVRLTRTRLNPRIVTLLALVAAFAVLTAGVVVWAGQQRTADRVRRAADARTAASRMLAARAASLADTDPDVAALLAVHAYREAQTPQAAQVLTAAADRPLLRTLTGQPDAVTALAVSRDGALVAAGGADGAITLWQARTGHRVAGWTGHDIRSIPSSSPSSSTTYFKPDPRVNALAFSPDGAILASAGSDHAVRLWRTRDGGRLADFQGHTGEAMRVQFTPDQTFLVSVGADGTVRIWDVRTGRQLGKGADPNRTAVLSPDGTTLAVGRDNGAVQLIDVQTRELRGSLGPLGADVVSAAFSPDGTLVAAASSATELRVWRTGTGQQVAAVVDAPTSSGVVFSPTGTSLAVVGGQNPFVANNTTVQLRDAATADIVATLSGSEDSTFPPVFDPTGAVLVTARGSSARIWDAARGDVLARLMPGPMATVAAFSRDGTVLATGGDDHIVRLWDGNAGRPAGMLRHPRADGGSWSTLLSPENHTVALSDPGADTIELYDEATGAAGRVLALHGAHPTAIRFSPDSSRLVASLDDRTVRLWDLRGDPTPRTFTGCPVDLTEVAVSPDRHTLAALARPAGREDRHTACLWRTDRTEPVATMPAPYVRDLRFSPDGSGLLGMVGLFDDDRDGLLWNAGDGREMARLQGLTDEAAFGDGGRLLIREGPGKGEISVLDGHTGRPHRTIRGVTELVAAPATRSFVARSEDRTLGIWDAGTGTRTAALTGARDSAVFSPDARLVAAVDDDHRLGVWDVRTGSRRMTTSAREAAQPVRPVFGPSGSVLAAVVDAADGDAVQVWDVPTGTPLHGFAVASGDVDALAIAAGGTAVIGMGDGSMRIWAMAVPGNAAVRQVCAAVGRDLTDREITTHVSSGHYHQVC